VRLAPSAGLWRHGDFLRFWGAQTISQFGTQVSALAIPLVAIIALDASAFAVAALATVEFLPFLLFALPAGVWVDRLPRRPILILADVARAAALASIPIAAAFGALTLPQLFVVGFVAGLFTVFFDVAYQSYLPSLVEREQLVDGNAKLEFSRSAAQIGGPGIGGALVSVVTAPYAIVVDALSYLWSALLLLRIRRREAPPQQTHAPSMRRELGEGLRYLLGDRRWRAVAAYVSTFNFFSNVAFSIFLVYAVRQLGLSALVIGVTFAVGNLGALVAAAFATRVGTRLGVGRTLVLGGAVGGWPMILIPLAPQSSPVPFLVASQILVAFGVVLYNVTAISYMQAVVPDRMLGRFNATRRWLVWGTIPLGNLVGGVLASTVGLRETLFVGALGCSASFLFMVFSPLRSIDRVPDDVGPDDELIRLPLEGQTSA